MLKGKKVTLRALRRDDLPKLCSFNNDVEVELASGGDPPIPRSLERLQADFDRKAGQGERDGADFAIEADGQFIGQCGLFNFDETSRSCELGITIGDREYWGRGCGRESVRLLLDYAFRLRNLHRVWLIVHADNQRALRAYQSCGFIEEGRQRAHAWSNGRYVDRVFMGILREEWTASGE